LTGDGPTGRFAINLLFPHEELPDQTFMVTTSMTVPVLARSIARLLSVSSPIAMFVLPRWELLDHEGSIVSRFLPGTTTLCPYLQPGSTVRVIVRSRLVGFPSSSSVFDFSAPPLDFFVEDAAIGLVQPDLSVFPAVGLAHFSPPPNLSLITSSRHGETPVTAISNLQSGENGGNDVNCGDVVGNQVLDVFGDVNGGDVVGNQILDVFENVPSGLQMGRQHSRVGIADVRRAIVSRQFDTINSSSVDGGLSPRELIYGSTKALHSSSSVGGDDTLRSSSFRMGSVARSVDSGS
jgi:hypothetical protein